MNLNKRICLKIAEAIKEHDQEVSYDDVVGCLLTSGAAFGKPRIGVKCTLIQLAAQMAIVSDYDFEQMESAIIQVLSSKEHADADPDFKKKIEASIKDTNKNN